MPRERFYTNRILIPLLAPIFASPLNAQDVDGAKVLDGLGATDDDIAQLEGGEIIAYSDEAYENSPRELSADAVMLIDTDLDAIVEALVDAVTVIPTKLMFAQSEIWCEADVANVA